MKMYRYYKGFDEKKHIARFCKFNKYVNYYEQIHIYVNKLYIYIYMYNKISCNLIHLAVVRGVNKFLNNFYIHSRYSTY